MNLCSLSTLQDINERNIDPITKGRQMQLDNARMDEEHEKLRANASPSHT